MRHIEKRVLNHTPQNLFNLVSDVNKYPEFLPWCLGARVKNYLKNEFDADLIIGFKIYKEVYSSQILLDPKNCKITVNYKDGPFEHLHNYWVFKENSEGCEVEFMVDFKFKSIFLQTVMESLFSEAVKRMVRAFENRANNLYNNNYR
ncbi:type II toxin-antitoxin system RatA family toxin [Alphaproteobacteria bacterium]|nr:type II toxin-antitoxin system RatA family toxin [Alphaproteobacteria bacterium]